jgi:hypothetical protein
MNKILFLNLFIILNLFILGNIAAETEEGVIISKNNEFGGKTVEYIAYDQSRYLEYFDLDNAKVKTEKLYSEDYPVLNGLEKLIKYYSFDKIIKEEKVFTKARSRETMVVRSILHYDRFIGKISKKEEYFTRNYMGHSMIFYDHGKKNKIEWYYPGNTIGIAKNIVYLDGYGKESKIISYYTQKTVEELGYYKRITMRGYVTGNYYRNIKQLYYFSDDFSLKNNGIFRIVDTFHYSDSGQIKKTRNYFDRNDKVIQIK